MYSRWIVALSVLGVQVFYPINVQCYVITSDRRYTTWAGNTVPFVIAPGYSTAEESTIRMAASQIQSDMGGCIRFMEFNRDGPIPQNMNYVIISKTGGPGTPAPTCYTFPGRIVSPTNPPTTYGQHMALMNGPNGCLGSVRNVMRMFASLLGLRGEHNKPGRDNYIQINQNNLSPIGVAAGAFRIYTQDQVTYDPNDFDYNSITMLEPLQYSTNGLPVITRQNGQIIFNAGRLSYRDCQGLSRVYNCIINCPTFF